MNLNLKKKCESEPVCLKKTVRILICALAYTAVKL